MRSGSTSLACAFRSLIARLLRNAGPLLIAGLVLGTASLGFAQAPPASSATAPTPTSTPTDEAAYRRTIDDAVSEFGAGRFEEARALFKRAHALSPNARTLRGLGMTAFELRAYVQAMRELRAALADNRKALEGEMRAKTEELIDKASKFVGVVRVELEPASTSLLIDGKPPTPEPDGAFLLDAGTHVIAGTAPEHKASNVRVLVEGDAEQTVRVTLESLKVQQSMIAPIDAEKLAAEQRAPAEPVPPPVIPPPPPRQSSSVDTWAVGTLIGAGAFGATAAIFWLLGGEQESQLEITCAPTCSDMQLEDSGIKTSDLMTNVFLGLGAASAVASGILFIVAASDSDDIEAPPSAALRIGPTGASIAGSF